jgi:primosomal protein N' (replication factor Y)
LFSSLPRKNKLSNIIGVLLPLPFNEVFDYKVPDDIHIGIGDFVKIPFGHGVETGVVWKIGKTCKLEDNKIKKILFKFELPPLSANLIKFINWTANYNMSFLGLTLKMAMSVKAVFEKSKETIIYKYSGKSLAEAGLKETDARKKIVEFIKNNDDDLTKSEISKYSKTSPAVINPLIENGVLNQITIEKKKSFPQPIADYHKVDLTDEQKSAANDIINKIDSGYSCTLIDGVTGSGKTEVYFEAIEECLKQGKQALILVPEISLTSQWLGRFTRRFGVAPAQWHSALGIKTRKENWTAVATGEVKVMVGARSALYLPYQNLGLIIIDESHDQSYKQEEIVNYQARDMGILRANLENIPIILATATPSIETLENVENGKYDIVKLKSRFATAELPELKIIDLKKDKPVKGSWGTSWISPTLATEIQTNLDKGEQTILFLNRRGYAPLTICRDCGHRIQCPYCTSWLTEHRKTNNLVCHHCGHSSPIPNKCPECNSEDGLTACGPGVERIAEEIKSRYPSAKITVLSSDITSNPRAISEVISQMEKNKIDILIGTQILAKGHHFPRLTLVGIIDADLGLSGGDLRACERTFQLLSQVAGRAGRGDKKGTVYLQTLQPENNVIQALINNDRDKFISLEKQQRKILKMPPFGKLAAVIISGLNQDLTEKIARYLGNCAFNNNDIITLGPAPAPIYVLRNKYRYRLLVKTKKEIKIQKVVSEWIKKVNYPKSVKIQVDIDPYNFL